MSTMTRRAMSCTPDMRISGVYLANASESTHLLTWPCDHPALRPVFSNHAKSLLEPEVDVEKP